MGDGSHGLLCERISPARRQTDHGRCVSHPALTLGWLNHALEFRPMTTIERCAWAQSHPILVEYHDNEYGHRRDTDTELFELVVLEIFQAGLSWLTILKKREAFRVAFDRFDPAVVARYRESERTRLLADAGIVRNRLKIDATIHNAQVVLDLIQSHGSFSNWLDSNGALDRSAWVAIFKKTFRFTGGEITNEFLLSSGYLSIDHQPNCFKYRDSGSIGTVG